MEVSVGARQSLLTFPTALTSPTRESARLLLPALMCEPSSASLKKTNQQGYEYGAEAELCLSGYFLFLSGFKRLH